MQGERGSRQSENGRSRPNPSSYGLSGWTVLEVGARHIVVKLAEGRTAPRRQLMANSGELPEMGTEADHLPPHWFENQML